MLGTAHPLKFPKEGRALNSALSKDERVRCTFCKQYGERFTRVKNYYAVYKDEVVVEGMTPWLPELGVLDGGHAYEETT